MSIFDTIKTLWTEYRTPTRIPIPTTQPAGTIGGTQIAMTPPSMRQPERVHAVTPTVHIHGREPAVERTVRIVRDPKTLTGVKESLTRMEGKIAEKIPSIDIIQQRGAEFRQKQPEIADVLYGGFERGAKVVKAPIQFMEHIEAEPKTESIHRPIPLTSIPQELRPILQVQQQEDFGAKLAKSYGETGKALGEYSVERYGMFEQAPLQTVGTEIVVPYAVGYGVGAGFKVGTFASRYGLQKAAEYSTQKGIGTAAKGFSFVGKALEPTVAAVTTAQIGSEVIKAETPKQRIEMLAQIGVGFAGAASGWRGAGKAIETYRVRGRTEVPLESIVEPEVLSGVESFPMTRRGETPTQLISRFKESEFKLPSEKDGTFVWHAAPETLGSVTTVRGVYTRSTDVPGLYTAPSLSPHFLRVTTAPKVSLYSRLFGSAEPLEPTALRIGVKDVVRLPESARYDIGKAREFLKTESVKGEATLTPVLETALRGKGKAEAEAVITPETMLGKVEQKHYLKIEGHKVPIDTYKTLDTGKRIGTIKELKPSTIKAAELAKTAESYKRYQEGLFKPTYYTSVGRSEIVRPRVAVTSIVSETRPPATPSRLIKPREPSYIGSIYESVPPSRPREPRSVIDTISSYVVPPSERYRPVPEIPRYQVPESPRYTPPTEIPPLLKLPKKDKKAEEKKRKDKLKEFQHFIVNPIASPFGNSLGKVNK